MGLFPNRIFGRIQVHSKFRIISTNEIANDFFEEDKDVAVRSEIIRTRLGC